MPQKLLARSIGAGYTIPTASAVAVRTAPSAVGPQVAQPAARVLVKALRGLCRRVEDRLLSDVLLRCDDGKLQRAIEAILTAYQRRAFSSP